MVYLASRIVFDNGIRSIVFAKGILGAVERQPGAGRQILRRNEEAFYRFFPSGSLASCAPISKRLATTGAENQRR
jgi:hypothetical protein